MIVQDVVKKGKTILKTGGRSDCVVILISGRVEQIERVGRRTIVKRVIEPMRFIGYLSASLGVQRLATYRAATDCTILCVSINCLRYHLDSPDPILRALCREFEIRSFELTELLSGRDISHLRPASFRSVINPDAQEAVRALQIEGMIDWALKNDAIEVWLMPELNLLNGHILGFEALVRMRTATGCVLPASEFIDVAERSGQILAMGRIVFRQACEAIEPMKKLLHSLQQDVSDFRMATNLCPSEINQEDFIPFVCKTIHETGVSPDNIALEVTERMQLKDFRIPAFRLSQLVAEKIRLRLDDFGTGHSSVTYLSELPFTELKLDRSLVISMEKPKSFQILRMIIGLARDLRMNVIAEGIASDEHVSTLRDLSCHHGMGEHYSLPLPVLDMTRWIEQRYAS